MANITIVSKIRLLAGIAPLVLLIVCPFVSLAFSAFGNIPATIKENQLASINYANGMDAALYKMEWGRTQPESAQIIVDQQRRFADMLDSAARNVYTAEQREKLQTLAQAASQVDRDLIFSRQNDKAVISSPVPLSGPVIYEFRLAHR